jgi:hypothetical protein
MKIDGMMDYKIKSAHGTAVAIEHETDFIGQRLANNGMTQNLFSILRPDPNGFHEKRRKGKSHRKLRESPGNQSTKPACPGDAEKASRKGFE